MFYALFNTLWTKALTAIRMTTTGTVMPTGVSTLSRKRYRATPKTQRTRLSQLTLSAVWSCLRMKKSDKRMAVIGAKTEPMR